MRKIKKNLFIIVCSFVFMSVTLTTGLYAQSHEPQSVNRNFPNQQSNSPLKKYVPKQQPARDVKPVEKGSFLVDTLGYNFVKIMEIISWIVLVCFFIGAKKQNMTWKPFYMLGAGILIFKFLFWILDRLIVVSAN